MIRRVWIPFMFTAAALMAGLCGILAGASGDYTRAAQFIMAAMVLDGIDGTAARLLRATSSFGAELDTFVDIICFGVAPAVLGYLAAWHVMGIWGAGLAFLVVLSGAARLSRFRVSNVSRGQQGFTGLPITVCGGWIALTVFLADSEFCPPGITALQSGAPAFFAVAVTMAMLLLQVSKISYGKPTKKISFFIPSALMVLLLFLNSPAAAISAALICFYGISYAFLPPLSMALIADYS